MIEEREVKKCLKRLKSFQGVVVVEGNSDKEALRDYGIDADIWTIKSTGLSIEDFALALGSDLESKANNEVMILTDFDSEGDYLAKRLRSLLEPWKVEVDHETRSMLESYLKKDLTSIEDISTLDLESFSVYHSRIFPIS